MLHVDLYNYLTETPEVASLFPGGAHHMSVPQDVKTWPAVSFFLVGEQEFADDAESPNDDKMGQYTYQFDVVGDDSAKTLEAADRFKRIFRNFRGTMLTTNVQWVQLVNVSHLEERRGDKLRRRVSVDFQIYIDEKG